MYCPADTRALITLVYELLDAHDDTARLAGDLACGEGWDIHLDYLRGLQRKGREVLANTAERKAA